MMQFLIRTCWWLAGISNKYKLRQTSAQPYYEP